MVLHRQDYEPNAIVNQLKRISRASQQGLALYILQREISQLSKAVLMGVPLHDVMLCNLLAKLLASVKPRAHNSYSRAASILRMVARACSKVGRCCGSWCIRAVASCT